MQPLILHMNEAQLGGWLGSFLWPFFRVASFLMVIPIIGTRLVAMRTRLGLALLIAIILVPTLGPAPEIDALSIEAVFVTLQQITIGTLMGFVFVMLMQLFVVAGQMISMQMGLGFASMVDPANGVNVPILSQLMLVGVTLMFLAMNGHLVMIEIMVDSFKVWPVSGQIFNPDGFSLQFLWDILHRISWLFASALLLALPAITAVLVINISFGIMTRAAPQMNVFVLGFPIAMIFGLLITWISFSELLPQFDKVTRETFLFLRNMQGL